MKRTIILTAAALGCVAVAGCKSNNLKDTVESVGSTLADGAESVAGTASSLVSVNLSDVLNDLALDLNIERANIPVNAQVPITLAANICGVSINILSVSTGGQANCTAKTSSPELAQVVQQQMAADGSVGGGSQGTSGTATSNTTTSGTGTSGTSTGSNQPTTDPVQPDPATPQ